MTKNVLYCGDNLEILATMEAESVDLVYIDPPFYLAPTPVVGGQSSCDEGVFLSLPATRGFF